jgi:hypothetical protein
MDVMRDFGMALGPLGRHLGRHLDSGPVRSRGGSAWGRFGALLAAAGLVCSAAVAAGGAAPPRVNLVVEWRWSEAAPRRPAGAGEATVVTGTLGSTAPAQGQVTVRSSAPGPAAPMAATAAPAVPALPARFVVANGGSARVRLAEAVPLQWVEPWQEPGGRGAVLRQAWTESAQAFQVRVQWPGGVSDAQIELEVEQPLSSAQEMAQLQPRREQFGTVVRVPLGQWVGVASWGEARGGPPAAPGTVSTADLVAGTGRTLQLRVSPATRP